jgi:hemerythrin-like domain-containing protein
MNTAAKNLEDDHVHILKLTEVMGRIIGSDEPDVTHLESIVDLIKNFADGLHHAKEENQYFPFLAGRGFSLSQGPVAVMIHEHKVGRDYVRGMEEGIALYKGGNTTALGKIYSNMAGYAELLQNHIAKENNILFRMADSALSEADNLHLLGEFEKAEASHTSGSPEDYIRKIDQLASFYGLQ